MTRNDSGYSIVLEYHHSKIMCPVECNERGFHKYHYRSSKEVNFVCSEETFGINVANKNI